MKKYRGRRGIAPLILNLSSRWRSVLSHPGSFTPGEKHMFPLNRRLGGPQSQSG